MHRTLKNHSKNTPNLYGYQSQNLNPFNLVLHFNFLRETFVVYSLNRKYTAKDTHDLVI